MSELVGISKAPQHLKPGMSHVIYSGDTLVIRDSAGDELAIEARENKMVMDFIAAYAAERKARLRGRTEAKLAHETELYFEMLPMWLLRDLVPNWP